MPTIATTILAQLGGPGRLGAMTGARDYLDLGNGLSFRIGRNAAKVNRVVVKLTAADLYDVQLLNVSTRRDGRTALVTISEAEGVYADQLRGVIERGTGLYLSLGTLGGRS